MARDDDVARELAEPREEVQRLRDAVAALSGTRREGRAAGRVRTLVEGFDAALEGGIPAGHVVILAGPSGSMKTSLALGMVYHNRREGGLQGLYISLEEGRETLLPTMGRRALEH